MDKKLKHKFDILSIILTFSHKRLNWFGKRSYINIVCIRSSLSALDSCVEFLFLCIENSESLFIDTTAKGLFFTCLISNIIYLGFVFYWLRKLKKKVIRDDDLILKEHEKSDFEFGKKVSFIYKSLGIPIAAFLAGFSGYLWQFYEGSVLVFIIAVIDACFDFVEFVYWAWYFGIKKKKEIEPVENTKQQPHQHVSPYVSPTLEVDEVTETYESSISVTKKKKRKCKQASSNEFYNNGDDQPRPEINNFQNISY